MAINAVCSTGGGATTGASWTLTTSSWTAQHASGITAPAAGDLVVICAEVTSTTAQTWSQSSGAAFTFHKTNDLNSTSGGMVTCIATRIWDGTEAANAPVFACTLSGRFIWGAIAIRPDAGNTVSPDVWATDLIDTTAATAHTANSATAAGSGEYSLIAHLVTAAATANTAFTVTVETGWTAAGLKTQNAASNFSQAIEFSDRTAQSGTVTPGAATLNLSCVANFYHLLVKQTPSSGAVAPELVMAPMTGV